MTHFGTLRLDRVHDADAECTRLRPAIDYLTLCGVPFVAGQDVAQASGLQSAFALDVDCKICLEKDSERLPRVVIEMLARWPEYGDEQLLEIGVPKDIIEIIFDGICELQDIIVTLQEVTEGHFNLLLPPGPKCRRCGHVPCPFCTNWCDVLLHDDPDQLQCCDGECDFPPDELAAWLATIDPILLDAEERGCGVMQRECSANDPRSP